MLRAAVVCSAALACAPPPSTTQAGDAGGGLADAGAGWSAVTELQPLEPEDGDRFGVSTAISGSRIAVGADRGNDDDPFATEGPSGKAYIFERTVSGWTQTARLISSDPYYGDRFGRKIAIDGDTVVVSASRQGGAGAAYVFAREGDQWVQQARFTVGSNASVAISGDTAVIGSPGAWYDGVGSGAVDVFVRDADGAWAPQVTLLPSDPVDDGRFGVSVAIVDDAIIVGTETAGGKIYLFRRLGVSWSEETAMETPTYLTLTVNAVAMSGARVMANTESGTQFFEYDGSTWGHVGSIAGISYQAGLYGDRVLLGNRLYLRDAGEWVLEHVIPTGALQEGQLRRSSLSEDIAVIGVPEYVYGEPGVALVVTAQ